MNEQGVRRRMVVATRHVATRTARWCGGRLGDRAARDRGDVPGWVLVTMMTAGLVAALWAVAGSTLSQLFTDAISGVSP
jgi:hypothetical protein